MRTIESYSQWLKKYRSNLEIIRNDLDLILNKNFEIFLAVDFHEIYEYCFPFPDLYILKNKDRGSKEYLKLQLSRSILFFMLNAIYKKPILLLPPYLREINDFLIAITSEAKTFTNEEDNKNSWIEYELRDIITYLNMSEKVDFEKLLGLLDSKAIDIVVFSGTILSSGMSTFKYLMKNYITPSPEFMENFPEKYYKKINNSILKFGNKDLEEIVSGSRHSADKNLQNKRDAEALRYIKDLNKYLNGSNKAIFLISSSPHMIRLQDSILINKHYGDVEIPLLRDPSFLFTMIQEIGNLFRYRMQKSSLDEICLEDLISVIDHDLIRIDSLLLDSTDLTTLGGQFRESVKMDILSQIMDLSDRLDNMDFALLIDEFLPNIDSLAIMKPDVIESDVIKSLKELSKLLEQDDFTERIFEKITELEKARLEYFWNLTKECDIINLLLPFKFFIDNLVYNKKITNILDMIVKGQLSVQEKGKISRKLLDKIHLQLKNLSEIEQEIEHDEKYLLWGFIFLILDRTDLVELVYKQFIDKISRYDIKRELAHIYFKSLLDSLMKRKGSKVDFMGIIILCETYGEIHVPVACKIDLQFKNIDLKSIRKLSNSLNIKLPKQAEFIQLSESAYAVKAKNPYYIIFYNKDNRCQIFSIDIRFMHLILICMNEYINDGLVNSINISEFIAKLENIYIPLVKKLEPDYLIALFSNYAFLLSQLSKGEQSNYYLFRALDLINELDTNSDAILWNYREYYDKSFVYFQLANNSKGEIRKQYVSKALSNLDRATESLPNSAKRVKVDVDKLKQECEELLQRIEI